MQTIPPPRFGRCWRLSLPQPGLDDDFREAPAVFERLRLLRLGPGPGEDRNRDFDDLRPVTESLDQDLARPELVLLQDELAKQVGSRGPIPARDVGHARAREDRHDPGEEMHAHVSNRGLLLEVAEQTGAVDVVGLPAKDRTDP